MITVTINAVNRSDDIDQTSSVYEGSVTKAPSTFSFFMKRVAGVTLPAMGDEVIVEEDSVRIFKGTIVERDDAAVTGLVLGTAFTCKDGVHEFDSLLVSKAYNDTDAVAVVQDIVDNFASGFTLDAPLSSPAVKSLRFNYEQPSKCLQALCQQIGWDWYIDPFDVVHFFPKGNESAPFEITDDNGNAIYNSLSFSSNIVELKNSVFLRGGEYLDEVSESDALDKYEADGQQVLVNLGFKYNLIEVTVDGTPKTVGIDNIDDPLDFDCLYNFQEKLIRFREDNKPAAGELVKAFGNVFIPLIVQAEDTVSIDQYGRKEGISIDKTITSVLEAEAAAAAVLDQWSEGSYEGSFSTRQTGLRAGQTIRITSASFGIDDTFKINRVRGEMDGHDSFQYEVQFIKSGEYNFTDIMVDLLGRDRKNITISEDEVIQRIMKFTDEFGYADEIIAFVKTTGPYKYGDVTGGNTVGKYNFSTYS